MCYFFGSLLSVKSFKFPFIKMLSTPFAPFKPIKNGHKAHPKNPQGFFTHTDLNRTFILFITYLFKQVHINLLTFLVANIVKIFVRSNSDKIFVRSSRLCDVSVNLVVALFLL
jgi:hypothetical protein